MPVLSHKLRRRTARLLFALLAATWLTAAAAPCLMDMAAADPSMAGMDCGKGQGNPACPSLGTQDCGAAALDCRVSGQSVSVDRHAAGDLSAPPLFTASVPLPAARPQPPLARRARLAARPPELPLYLRKTVLLI